MAKPQREKPKHLSAFLFYYSMGDSRSLVKVAERFGITPQAAGNWSVAFRWQARVREYDEATKKLQREQAIQDASKSREESLMLIRAARAKFAVALKGGDVVVSASDFERLTRLEQLLRGAPTDRPAVTVEGGILSEFIERIAGLVERCVPDLCPSCKSPIPIRDELATGLQLEAERILGEGAGPGPAQTGTA